MHWRSRQGNNLLFSPLGAMDKLAGHAAGNASIQPSVSLGASREDPALFSACSTCQGLTDVMFSHAKGAGQGLELDSKLWSSKGFTGGWGLESVLVWWLRADAFSFGHLPCVEKGLSSFSSALTSCF